ncbi:DUF3515 family protein [Demequina capsici]|uniref:DUF3515 family protein n=1 Tax=Demequina capsici TaxID=3075620 RepID=A0AA96J7N8_9MICO|nr:DUF3515 family protein [Demequina sp. OYTSA14]WNM25377.1 DUF3515 family protein [Demequina sp. OYTSA14]
MPRKALALGLLVLGMPLLASCASPYAVDPAKYAADPDCARVMLAMPDVLGGLDKRTTTSQATAAWGDDEGVVVARCGVEPPGPTTDECLSVDATTGTQDWIIDETDDSWIATTFGRSPALEVTVPKVRADQALGDLLAVLSGPAALAPTNGLQCL